MLSCVNEYNPFKDMSNVKILVDNCSFSNKDSVKLFSAETLNISLTLKDHIDSFTIIAEKNRLWTDTTICKMNGLYDTYSFIVSFKDTGKTGISLFLFRGDGTSYSEDINCRVFSPLYQEPIIGTFDDSIILTTAPVDDQVKYHWDLGKGSVYWSYTPSLKCLVTQAANDSTGWLWVSDESESHLSPKSRFTFVLRDTLEPRITCINKHMIGTDTVLTGDTNYFTLKFHITDRISDNVKKATIDNKIFDYIDPRNNIYTAMLEDMKQYTAQAPLTVAIYAEDAETPPNTISDTFYIYYDKNIDPTPKTIILIHSVNANTIFTSTTLYSIFGEVINIEQQPINLTLYLNGQPDSCIKTFNTGNGEWHWKITLEQDTLNQISITATDTDNVLQSTEYFFVYHDSHFADTTKPIFAFVSVEGMDPVSFITPVITPKISVTTYDGESYVKTVTIADSSASDTLQLAWSSVIALLHGKNNIPIISTDSADNRADTLVIVYHNTLPFLTGGLQYPFYIVKGVTYSDTLKPYDFDNDTVSISPVSTSIPGLALNSLSNILTWQTDSVSLGPITIALKLNDGYQDTILQWNFEVIDSTEIFYPVRFKTTVSDFPGCLIAGSEHLVCTLSVVDTTGKKPFSYTVYIQDVDTFLLSQNSDSIIQWSPTNQDLGTQQLVITVTDTQNTSDTLLPVITIVPENQYNCSLSVVSLDTAVQINYSTNTLDLSGVTDTIVLAYTIHDQDHPITEHYHVTKKIGNLSQSFDPDSTCFTIAVIPKPGASNDTLIVVVVDNTGKPFSISLTIIHPTVTSPDKINNLLYWLDASDSKKVLNSDGNIAERTLYNRTLNENERNSVALYPAYKYGIKLNK